MSLDQAKVQDALEQAIETLIDQDPLLLELNVNERSITHHLAIYLDEKLDEFGIPHDVDVEYNRATEDSGVTDSLIKRVKYDRLSEMCRGRRITDQDTDAQTVFPGHHRSQTGFE